jgi:hypothetical protein
MVHVPFDVVGTRFPDALQYGEGSGHYYEGRVFQRGNGMGYAGRHSGDGMGDVLRSVWRYLKPMALGAAKTVGRESLDAGGRILTNLAKGEDLHETVKNEGKEGIKRVLDRASRKMQKGSGLRRIRLPKLAARSRRRLRLPARRINSDSVLPAEINIKPEPALIGRTVPATTAIKKRSKSDALGFY